MSIGLYWKLALASFKSSVYTKVGFLLQIVASIIQMIPSMLTMLFVVLRFGAVVHWKFGDYIFMFIFANLSYGLRNIFMGSFRYVPSMIINGQLDQYITKPVNTLLYLSASQFGWGSMSYMILSVLLFFIFMDLFTVKWTLFNMILFPIAVLSGAMVQGAITLFISCAAFFMMDSRSIDNIYSGFREFIWYPLDIFSNAIQIILFTVMPLAFACFVPCGLFLRNNAFYQAVPISVLYLSLFVGPILLALSVFIWKVSLKKYASSGT